MKDKITIEQLAMYLPYGLEAAMLNFKSDYVGNETDEIQGLYLLKDLWHCETMGGSRPSIDRIAPILHRLDSLAKPIVVKGDNDGKEFVPEKELKNKGVLSINYGNDIEDWFFAAENVELFRSLEIMQLLISWHFWIYDQSYFDKGLLIDKATL